MKPSLILVIMLSLPAEAGWWSDLCAKHLIAADPAPHAEVETDLLLIRYERTRSGSQLDELLYRYRNKMMSYRQVVEFREKLTRRN